MARNVAHHLGAMLLFASLGACGETEGEADPCKPDGQEAVVVVGEGSEVYAPLAEGDVMAVEAGPQGGHHVWVALRARGLESRGSLISVTGRAEAISATVGPFATILELHPAEDGWCEVAGVRFQVDQEVPMEALDGQTMSLTAEVRDEAGAVADDTREVVLVRGHDGGSGMKPVRW